MSLKAHGPNINGAEKGQFALRIPKPFVSLPIRDHFPTNRGIGFYIVCRVPHLYQYFFFVTSKKYVGPLI